jgi:hypothetical protein
MPNIDVLQHRNTLRLLILLLATLLLPGNFVTQRKSIPISVFFHILSAWIAHRKQSLYFGMAQTTPKTHVSRVRLRVDWSVSSTGRCADDIENTASSIVACWAMFIELLPGNALIKSVTILSRGNQ